MQETKKAFRQLAKKKDVKVSVDALCNLKGVGPAMASGTTTVYHGVTTQPSLVYTHGVVVLLLVLFAHTHTYVYHHRVFSVLEREVLPTVDQLGADKHAPRGANRVQESV